MSLKSSLLASLCACFLIVSTLLEPTVATQPSGIGVGKSFKGPLGVQLYSFRKDFARDVPGTLAKVRALGFRNVELAGTYGLTPQAFRAELDKAGLKALSMHVSLADFRDRVDQVISDAKILGATYVGVAWIKVNNTVTADEIRNAAAILNRAGEKLAAAGLKVFYHIHGYEFQPADKGTLFDIFIEQTNPKFVDIQMDIYWAVHGGQDPVKMFVKYPGRITSMHLKDMRKGVVGNFSGQGSQEDDVALGTGQIDFVAALRAAKKAGVKWYFIEDESSAVYDQIPVTLKYLEQVKF
jgi:sugar phosphate isomerase/epimerase